MTDKLQ